MQPKIKMRIHDKTKSAKCAACGCKSKQAIEMFDVKVGTHNPFCICDDCMEDMFHFSLKATCHTNSKIKDQKDIAIRNSRNSKRKGLMRYGNSKKQ